MFPALVLLNAVALTNPLSRCSLPLVKRATYHIEYDREDDGRWIAEVREMPGTMVYGGSKKEARSAVIALALHVIADRIEHGEPVKPRAVDELFASSAS